MVQVVKIWLFLTNKSYEIKIKRPITGSGTDISFWMSGQRGKSEFWNHLFDHKSFKIDYYFQSVRIVKCHQANVTLFVTRWSLCCYKSISKISKNVVQQHGNSSMMFTFVSAWFLVFMWDTLIEGIRVIPIRVGGAESDGYISMKKRFWRSQILWLFLFIKIFQKIFIITNHLQDIHEL